MRIARTVFVAVALFALCGAAQARDLLGSFSISPFGGVGIPIGDFADTDADNEKAFGATSGFCLGGAVEYGLTENLAVGGRFSYNQFGVDDEYAESAFEGATFDGDYKVTELFGAYVKLLMSAGKPTRPFVRAGVFAAKPKLTGDLSSEFLSGEVEAEVDNSLGLDAGVGVLHMFSEQIGGFVEGSISHLMTDEKDVELSFAGETETDVVDGNIQWITVRAGVTIYLGGAGGQ